MVAKDYTDPVYQFRPAHLLRLLPLLFGFYLFDQLVHNRFDVVDTGDEFEFRQRWLFGRTMSLPKAKVRGVELIYTKDVTYSQGDVGTSVHVSHLFKLDVTALGTGGFRLIEWSLHGPSDRYGEQAIAVAEYLSQLLRVKCSIKKIYKRR
jgi:hypothetical protein